MPELDVLRAAYPAAVPAAAEARERSRARIVARDRGFGGRLRWPVAVSVAAAVAGALIFIGLGTRSEGSASAATRVLRHAAAVARRQAPPAPLGPGQYLYVKSVNAYLNTVVPASTPYFSVLVPHVREVWLGPDVGKLHETDGEPSFLSARDRERWIAAGRPPVSDDHPTDTKLSPLRPLDLPSDADALYERLKRDATGHGSSLYEEMFTLVGDSLRETNATPAQRAALYEVAARIPGVELVGRVHDPAGRPGVAVAMRHAQNQFRETLVFDPATSELLAEEQVSLPDNTFGYPAGTVVGHATYLTRAVVDGFTRPQ